jgi:NAD(P)-dependent dehydrogenase (short-subunit alcohol dehydrogenase family)
LAERSILITGCSSGIGLASAQEMKARGWRVFATARKPEDITRLRGEGFDSLYLDYAEPESIEAAASEVLAATGGRLDALFNNGAYGQPGAVEDLRRDVLRAQFEAGFFGWHDLTRRVIPAMRKQGHGRIVFCSSVLGLVSAPYRAAYCAAKFAVEALADALRMELASAGIKVVLIEPGPIATRFLEHALEAYRRNIDLDASPHAEIYRTRIARLEQGGDQTFKLGPKRSRRSSPARLKAATQGPAITLRYRPMSRRCCAASFQRVSSTRSPLAIRAAFR